MSLRILIEHVVLKKKALKINAKASEWDLQTPIIIEIIGWVD